MQILLIIAQSQICHFGKRAVAKQLQSFLYDTLVLDPFQYSFYPGQGTKLALVMITDGFHRQLDPGMLALLLLLDLIGTFTPSFMIFWLIALPT